jgi:hypothetical protein
MHSAEPRPTSPGSTAGYPTVIVLEPHNIILTKIGTVLYFDDMRRFLPRIFQSMFGVHRDGRTFADVQIEDVLISRDARGTADYHPMFTTLMMHLE